MTLSTTIALAFACALTLAGCGGPDNEIARERFARSRMILMTDEEGNRYAVQHHAGNVYRVVPIGPIPDAK